MSERTEDILDCCIEAGRRGEDPEQILARHPERSGELRSLLEVAGNLKDLGEAPVPGGEQMRGLIRAQTRALTRQRSRSHGALFSRSVLLRAAALVLVVLALAWGTTTASAGAVPGDLLYPVKLATERVNFFLTVNDRKKAELRLVFSQERLSEAVEKYDRGEGLDKKLLDQMLEEARRALASGEKIPDRKRPLLLSRARHLSEHHHEMLQRLKTKAAPEERQELEPYIRRCRSRHSWMERAPSEPQKPRRESEERQGSSRRWRQWMGRCPR